MTDDEAIESWQEIQNAETTWKLRCEHYKNLAMMLNPAGREMLLKHVQDARHAYADAIRAFLRKGNANG